jgi:hypothetical protein
MNRRKVPGLYRVGTSDLADVLDRVIMGGIVIDSWQRMGLIEMPPGQQLEGPAAADVGDDEAWRRCVDQLARVRRDDLKAFETLALSIGATFARGRVRLGDES